MVLMYDGNETKRWPTAILLSSQHTPIAIFIELGRYVCIVD